jgi:subtilisin family serine protease
MTCKPRSHREPGDHVNDFLRGIRVSVVCCLALAAVNACATTIKPSIDPGHRTPTENAADQLPPPTLPEYSLGPETAFQLQKMPLYTTGIPRFLDQHPTYDGRGILIAILDSGVDADIPGLTTTTTGDRKILDLRDFSGEGRISLSRAKPVKDSISVSGITLGGFGRVVLFNAEGPWYGGVLREETLGSLPAADVDGNGRVGDHLPVIVTRASDGWILLADTDRNGSLLGEKPIRDYLASRQTFSWTRKGASPRISLAANFSDSNGLPVLDLFFDTSGHGSHVAGIAAGHDLYGVKGFNGVAPGAQILGLKIANNAQGGLSTGGSMIRAMDYAIRFATRRRLTLVLNLSFAVGNEIEGQARIDQLIDSMLAAHPELVLTLSAGNDGPGLTTVGFPGSAARAVTVGAVLPGDPGEPDDLRQEPVAYYSARGGEVSKPEILAPGVAYSTVPPWDRGQEVKSGTSMASPHAAGLVALLYSGLLQEQRPIPSGRTTRHALMVTARPVPGAAFPDQGAGIPEISSAYRWLRTGRIAPEIEVRAEGGVSGAYHATGLRGDGDTLQQFTLVRPAGLPPATYSLRSNANWLVAPASVTLTDSVTVVSVRYRAEPLRKLGTTTGVVTGWPADTMAGPAFRLVNTVAQSFPGVQDIRESSTTPIPAGEERRVTILADSGRPFEVSARIGSRAPLLVFLHEPSGMLVRGSQPQIAGSGQEMVSFKVDGRDVVRGAYELVAVAPPTEPSSARFELRAAPLFDARREPTGVVTRISTDTAGGERKVRMSLVGAERQVVIEAKGSDTVTTNFVVPSWATRVVVDLNMTREQWARFTDFGLTLLDVSGRHIESSPLNYAFGRVEAALDLNHGESPVSVALFPALAEPGSSESWQASMSIRIYPDQPVTLSVAHPGGSAPGDEETTFTLPPSPWPLADQFFLLGQMELTDQGERWTREVPLPEPGSPLPR